MNKEYKCYRCNTTLDYIPIRIYKYEYGAGKYHQYYPTYHYDLCRKCYYKLNKWMEKNNIPTNP